MEFETRAIHAGQEPDPATGAVNVPIYASSTFAQDGVGGMRGGYEYGRTGNPTRTALEANLAAIESGTHGRAFSSGMAATDCVIRAILRPGDHLVIPNDAYGGTFRLIDKVFSQWGIEHSVAPIWPIRRPSGPCSPSTTLVWIETPTNPLLKVVDIEAVARLARAAGARVVVDNTFASPVPAVAACARRGRSSCTRRPSTWAGTRTWSAASRSPTTTRPPSALHFVQNSVGAVPAPLDCFLTLRGVKTLAVRMERHCDNAEAIVERLGASAAVEEVFYPGLASHSGHAVAARQMRRFGGMVSFRVRGGRAAADAALADTGVWTLGESLGGVESLIEHPGEMTHASLAGSGFEVPDDLIRLSVGIEHVDDLVRDLDAMLAAAERAAVYAESSRS